MLLAVKPPPHPPHLCNQTHRFVLVSDLTGAGNMGSAVMATPSNMNLCIVMILFAGTGQAIQSNLFREAYIKHI